MRPGGLIWTGVHVPPASVSAKADGAPETSVVPTPTQEPCSGHETPWSAAAEALATEGTFWKENTAPG